MIRLYLTIALVILFNLACLSELEDDGHVDGQVSENEDTGSSDKDNPESSADSDSNDAKSVDPGEDASQTQPGDGVDTKGSDEPDTNSPPEEDVTQGPPIEKTLTTFIGDWDMSPGKEITKCVVKRLDNEDTVFVTAIHTKLAKGSHHMIVYKSDAEKEILEPEECFPFTETLSGETVPLIISQVGEETLALPPGIAFRFDPGQMIRIEAHYLNYYDHEITAHADVEFDTISVLDLKHEANMLFYGTPDFELPPGEEHTTDWFFLDMPEGAELFAMTGHTHQYGTNVEVALATQDNKNDAPDPSDLIYPGDATYDWDEPPILQFDPPIKFAKGEGFRYRCTWFNTSDKKVGFGEGANDEMCFFWGYFYPSQAYRICINPGSIAGGLGPPQVCCPEDKYLCDLVKTFL